MSFLEKIENAKNTKWVSEGIADNEIKTIIDLARISALIEHRRVELGMTQKEFAEYMGVSQGMVSKWESREYNFTIKSLNEICQKLELNLFIDITKPCTPNDYKVLKWNEDKLPQHKMNISWINKIHGEGAIA